MTDKKRDQFIELEHRRSMSEGVRGILSALNSTEPLNAILDYITVSAGQQLYADAVSIYHFNAEANILTIRASRGLDDEYLAQSTIRLGESTTGKAVLEGQPVSISDIRDNPQDIMGMLDSDSSEHLDTLSKHYRAVLSAPMIIRDEKIGALTLYYAQPRTFEQEEIDMAVSFCDQAALAIENARLRDKSQEDAVAAERNRIARDLHDSVTQTLFSASLIAEVLPAIWNRDPGDAEQSLGELRQLTRAALAEMRTLLHELRPVGLIEGRLEDLLKQLAEGVSGRLRTPLLIRIEGDAILPPDVKLVFYRIAQEALNNLARHANANEGEVVLKSMPARGRRRKQTGDTPAYSRSVHLLIRDDGCGFDPRAVTSEHMGLGIMRERAQSVQVGLTIHSKPGAGTQISLTWPVSNQNEQP